MFFLFTALQSDATDSSSFRGARFFPSRRLRCPRLTRFFPPSLPSVDVQNHQFDLVRPTETMNNLFVYTPLPMVSVGEGTTHFLFPHLFFFFWLSDLEQSSTNRSLSPGPLTISFPRLNIHVGQESGDPLGSTSLENGNGHCLTSSL